MNTIPPEWESVILRLMSEARSTLANNTSDGIAVITMHIAVDGKGNPLLWVVPDGDSVVSVARIEPSKDAKDTLINILSK